MSPWAPIEYKYVVSIVLEILFQIMPSYDLLISISYAGNPVNNFIDLHYAFVTVFHMEVCPLSIYTHSLSVVRSHSESRNVVNHFEFIDNEFEIINSPIFKDKIMYNKKIK